MKTSNQQNGKQPETEVKKSGKKKWLFLGLGIVATGVLSFFGYSYWKKNKEQSTSAAENAPDFSAKKSDKPVTTSTSSKPKTKTSKASGKTSPTNTGTKNKSGTKTPPKKSNNSEPPPKTENKKSASINPSIIAKVLYNAIMKRDFFMTIGSLQTMHSVNDYYLVNQVFSKYVTNGVRQTIVNAALSSFKTEKQKEVIRKNFLRMGLKYDGKKWSLAGIDQSPLLITIHATKVWKDPKTSVPVPLNMVLGEEITKRGNFTVFENAGQFFLVESRHVKNYTA